jgi:solute:Na+ symporter, SSS family
MLLAQVEPSGLHVIDWLMILLYGGGVLWLGWFFSRRQTSRGEYFTGGGNMPPALIGISLFVTLLSTISYLAQPGEMIKHGPIILASFLAIPVSYGVVGYFLIPVLMRQRVTSAYELLEARLGMTIRLLGASMFILLRLVWMSLLVYLTSSALVVVLRLDTQWIPAVAAASGLVAIIYTSMGGIRTVVITDLFQFCLLFGGAVLTIVFVSIKMGGLGWWPTEWADTWDAQPIFSLDPRVRATAVGAILSALVWQICTAGGDQTAIQRYMSTRDARTARRSYLVTSTAQVVVGLVLACVGFALLGYFKAHPEGLPEGMNLVQAADRIFPFYIAHYLPIGVSGLVVAAMFAAAMSSIDSGVNSITAVVQTDFVMRFRHRTSEKEELRFAKFLAFGIGLLIVTASSVMQYVPGNFLEVTQKTTNLLVTPIFALFFLALFVPFATPLGAIAGCMYGVATAVLVGYWDVITGQPRLSFQWIGFTALTANLCVACAVSYCGPRRQNTKAVWTAGVILVVFLAAMVGTLVSFARA